MTRTLLTHASSSLDGQGKMLVQLAAALSSRPDDDGAVFAALPDRGPLADELERAGAMVEIGELGIVPRSDLSPGRFPRFLKRARTGSRFVERLVKRHGIDLVHTHSAFLIGAAGGAYRSTARHLWHVHEIVGEPAWANRCIRSLISRWSDAVIASSRATAAAMLDARIAHVAVVHSGLAPTPPLGTDPGATRRAMGIEQGTLLVVLAGEINAWRGQRLLVRAADILRSRGEAADVRFILSGDPPPGPNTFVRDLLAEVEQRRLGGRVTRSPGTAELPALLAAADVCVVPSTRPEAFSFVALEAMSAGTPVIAADHGSLKEIVRHGTTGLRFVPRCPHSLADALERVLADEVLRGRLGRAAIATQRERFTVERWISKVVEQHRALLARERGRDDGAGDAA